MQNIEVRYTLTTRLGASYSAFIGQGDGVWNSAGPDDSETTSVTFEKIEADRSVHYRTLITGDDWRKIEDDGELQNILRWVRGGITLQDAVNAAIEGHDPDNWYEDAEGALEDARQQLDGERATLQQARSVLARCESFLVGFEDDATQVGIPALLVDLRAVMREAAPAKGSWAAVFGHLGTPDEAGNEWHRMCDAVRALLTFEHEQGQRIDGHGDDSRAVPPTGDDWNDLSAFVRGLSQMFGWTPPAKTAEPAPFVPPADYVLYHGSAWFALSEPNGVRTLACAPQKADGSVDWESYTDVSWLEDDQYDAVGRMCVYLQCDFPVVRC